jgi:hypothetical protein
MEENPMGDKIDENSPNTIPEPVPVGTAPVEVTKADPPGILPPELEARLKPLEDFFKGAKEKNDREENERTERERDEKRKRYADIKAEHRTKKAGTVSKDGSPDAQPTKSGRGKIGRVSFRW